MKIHDALYDIHEYADILRRTNAIRDYYTYSEERKRFVDVEGLCELILERVDFICEQLGMDE